MNLSNGLEQILDLGSGSLKTQVTHKELDFRVSLRIERSVTLLARLGFRDTDGSSL
jgi:hypothetical protein